MQHRAKVLVIEQQLAITLTKARSRILTELAVLAVRSALAMLGEPGVFG